MPRFNNGHEGAIDSIDGHILGGWARRVKDPQFPLAIDVYFDDQLIETVLASSYRVDLDRPKFGNGCFGFSLKLPNSLDLNKAKNVRIAVSGTQTIIAERIVGELVAKHPISHRTQAYIDWNLVRIKGELQAPSKSAPRRVALLAMSEPNVANLRNAIELVKGLKSVCERVVVINNQVSHSALDAMSAHADCVLSRINDGRDFGSWKIALHVFREVLSQYDEIVFINDSVFGPIYPLSDMFEKMQSRNHDVWSASDHWTPYHLQSYFMVFRKTAIDSGTLFKFFDNYEPTNSKSLGIVLGEQGLSRDLINAGLNIGAFVDYSRLVDRFTETFSKRMDDIDNLPEASALPIMNPIDHTEHFGDINYLKLTYLMVLEKAHRRIAMNPYAFFSDLMIKDFGFPFVKRELIRDNPGSVQSWDWRRLLTENTDYDVSIITETAKHWEQGLVAG